MQQTTELERDPPRAPAVPAAASTIRRGQDVIEAFRTAADDCVVQWLGNIAIAAGAHEALPAEVIHQLRVALRRLRSLLKLFAPVLPGDFVTDWKRRLRDNAALFAAARDLDVFCTELLEPAASEGLACDLGFDRLQARAARARAAARQTAEGNLDPAAQRSLVEEFNHALKGLANASERKGDALRSFARARLARLRKRARRRAKAAADLAPARLHALRIAFKELRYATEFFAPLLPKKAVRRYLRRMRRAQDNLGFLQDMVVARARLHTWAAEEPPLAAAAGFTLGWHAPRRAKLRARVLRDCKRALRRKTPW